MIRIFLFVVSLTFLVSCGSEPEITWSVTNLEQGGVITLKTTSTKGFGKYGPVILARITMRDEVEGDEISLDEGVGIMTSNGVGLPTVAEFEGMPYGKAIAIGTDNSEGNSVDYRQAKIVNADQQRYTEWYESYYLYWPEENQNNAYSYLDETAVWQIKLVWHLDGASAYNNQPDEGQLKTDIFTGLPQWYTSQDKENSYFTNGYKFVSNDKPISTTDRSSSGIRDPGDSTRWISSPMFRQTWVKPGPNPGPIDNTPDEEYMTGSDGMYRITNTSDGSNGLIEEKSYMNGGLFSAGKADSPGVDRFHIPGYVRGFNKPLGSEMYISDFYVSIGNGPSGEGAVAKIEITDHELYEKSKLFSVMSVTSWSEEKVVATIHKGIFEDLVGKHIWITDYLNVRTYVGQFTSLD